MMTLDEVMRWIKSWASRGPVSEQEVRAAIEAYAAEQVAQYKQDAERWQFFVRHASLGFDAAPSWNAVIRLPVFDVDDDTITKLVDAYRARAQEQQT